MDLRELRQRANLRVIDVAYRIDVSETSVRNWESGRTIPKLRLDEFGLLAQLYGCTLDVLYAAMQETQAKAAKQAEERPQSP